MSVISIIIINEFDTVKYLEKTVISIEEKITNIEYEIIIVNMKMPAEDDSRKKLKVYFLKTDNLAKAKNYGAAKSNYGTLFFLKAGIEIKINPFTFFFEKFASRNFGAAALKLYDFKNNFKINFWRQVSLTEEIEDEAIHKKLLKGNTQKSLAIENQMHDISSVSRISSDAMIIKKEILNSAGGFDEYFIKYYDDADLCVKLLKKKSVIYFYPFCKLVDLTYDEIDKPLLMKSRLRYYKAHEAFPARFILRISLIIKYLLFSLSFTKKNFRLLKSALLPY